MTSAVEGDVQFYSESLNLSQFSGERHESVMLDYFRRKYADKRLDLIVAVFSSTLDFLLRHREEVFQTIPIVFCGVDTSELTRKMIRPDVTGVLARRDYAPSVELALSLQPNTRNIYVVGGTSAFDVKLQTIARRDLAPLEGQRRITWLTTLGMQDLLKTVATLPPDSVILYLTIFADAAGRTVSPYDALSLVTKAANAPTYVAFDQYVGRGAVGGRVYTMETSGRDAAAMGARILKGEATGHIAVAEAVNYRNLFDWRELERWHIDESRLPPKSTVVFRPPTVWDLYKWYIVAGIILIVLQSALIAGLLISLAQRNRAEKAARESELRRRRAEEEVRQQREELAHALRSATLGELAASFTHELGQPLTAMLSNAEAVRRIRQTDPAHPEIDEALADIAEGAKRAGETIGRLRMLVRKQHAQRTWIDLNELIDEMVRLLRSDLIQKRVEVRLTPGNGLPPVYGDPVQLRQVMLNVLVNSEDSIVSAADGPREIDIRTRLTDDGAAAITVRDTGAGLDESELEHMFERFVTSKPEGLGMGLAISRSIVESHGGRIWASRNERRGITVHIELPVGETVETS
jgi:signal transduction histidine kinase